MAGNYPQLAPINLSLKYPSLAARPSLHVVAATHCVAKPQSPVHTERVEQTMHTNEFFQNVNLNFTGKCKLN